MLSFSQIAAGSILLQIVSGSNLIRISKRDATADLIPSPCVKTCNLAQTGFATCMAATPPGFNASTDIAADLAYLKCSCTDAIALNTGSCTSCISTLLVNNTVALANQNVSILIDGSFLSAFNYGCQAYGKVATNQTWTNATYTTSGGFDGNGTKIEPFVAAVVTTSSSAPIAASTAAVTSGNSSIAGSTMVPIASASAAASAATAKPTSASSKSTIVNLTGLSLTVMIGLAILTL